MLSLAKKDKNKKPLSYCYYLIFKLLCFPMVLGNEPCHECVFYEIDTLCQESKRPVLKKTSKHTIHSAIFLWPFVVGTS